MHSPCYEYYDCWILCHRFQLQHLANDSCMSHWTRWNGRIVLWWLCIKNAHMCELSLLFFVNAAMNRNWIKCILPMVDSIFQMKSIKSPTVQIWNCIRNVRMMINLKKIYGNIADIDIVKWNFIWLLQKSSSTFYLLSIN